MRPPQSGVEVISRYTSLLLRHDGSGLQHVGGGEVTGVVLLEKWAYMNYRGRRLSTPPPKSACRLANASSVET
jgi:hypothetical protein